MKLPDVIQLHRILNKHILLAAVFFFLSYCIVSSRVAVADESIEYKIKAAFLYKFSAYVNWPPSTFNSPSEPFSICLAESNELFKSTLEKVVNGEAVYGRPVMIRQINKHEPETSCQILYIGNHQRAVETFDSSRFNQTLTVSDGASPGVIEFFISDNRVRFNIDDEAAAKKGLVISSKLLSLAVNVKRRTSPGE
jgi:hypothetical protein